jgi:hypothetical protein
MITNKMDLGSLVEEESQPTIVELTYLISKAK